MRWLRAASLESLKERLELAGTQPQKFEMRPVWGAKHQFAKLALSVDFIA